MVESVGIGAAVLLVAVALFQAALTLGAPWGDMAYGGQAAIDDGVLPARYRAMSAGAALILVFAAWIVVARAGAGPSGPLGEGFLKWATWVIVGFLVLNTMANLASRSSTERWVMGSTTTIAAVLCLIVALSA